MEAPGGSIAAAAANEGGKAIVGPLYLVFDGLKKNVRLRKPDGFTQTQAPTNSPYRIVLVAGDGVLAPGEELTLWVRFRNPSGRGVKHRLLVPAGPGSQ
jgi:hypothetical protein